MNECTYKTIDRYRFILAIMVVFIHAGDLYHVTSTTDNAYGFVRMLFENISALAVPAFYFFSGFLFYNGFERRWEWGLWKKKIGRRVNSLLIPYVIWNIIAFGGKIVVKVGGCLLYGNPAFSVGSLFRELGGILMFWNVGRSGEDISVLYNILGQVVHSSMPIDYPLWFLRDLIVVVAISPLIYLFVKQTRYLGIAFLSILMIFNIWIPFEGLSSCCFFFFSMGALYRLEGITDWDRFGRMKLPSILTSVILISVCTFFWLDNRIVSEILKRMYTVSALLLLLSIDVGHMKGITWKYLDKLSVTSFFVFASHTIVVIYAAGLVAGRLFPVDATMLSICGYLFTVMLTVSSCLVIYVIMKRWTPRLLRLLNGGRV